MKSSREPPIPSRRGQGPFYAQQGSYNPIPTGGGSSGVSSFQGRTGAVSLLAADVSSALGYTAADAAHSHGNVTTSVAGFMSAADKTKLDGVATGATANDTDANLKNRANHTGTQAAGTITGLASIATSGSANDLGAGTIPAARMPAMTGDATSAVGAVALTLATVNANVGTFGNSTTVPVITVNAKGLVTAVSTAVISGGGGGGGLSVSTVEVNLCSKASLSGSFTISGAGMTVGKPVIIGQAAGPYTGKGDLQDEAEMDQVDVTAVVTSATAITAHWVSRNPVMGNFKFNYFIGA